MSRVGGGGYAENRGGFGDRTGGGMSGNARDGRDGMGNDGRAGSQDSRARNSRYSQNQIATGPLTGRNLMELGKMMPGPGMVARGIAGAAGITGPLGGPSFEGVSPRSGTGYSYDGPNRFGTGANAAFRPNMPTMNPNKARAQALAPSNPMVAPDWWRMPF